MGRGGSAYESWHGADEIQLRGAGGSEQVGCVVGQDSPVGHDEACGKALLECSGQQSSAESPYCRLPGFRRFARRMVDLLNVDRLVLLAIDAMFRRSCTEPGQLEVDRACVIWWKTVAACGTLGHCRWPNDRRRRRCLRDAVDGLYDRFRPMLHDEV